MQGLGLSLKEIQDVMVPPASEVRDALSHIESGLDQQISLVGGRIESLQGELDELKAARAKLAECRVCDHEVHSEACRECNAASPAVLAVLRSLA
jgi:DNA-binding transcriptional MerR regulator